MLLSDLPPSKTHISLRIRIVCSRLNRPNLILSEISRINLSLCENAHVLYPLDPNFYIVKLPGLTGVHIFLFLFWPKTWIVGNFYNRLSKTYIVGTRYYLNLF